MDADGGNQQRLTNNRHDDWDPSWSPDGKRIVFFSNRDGHVMDGRPTFEIYVMDADGGNQQRLTNNRYDDWDPSWSPDGKRIAFVSKRDKKVKTLYLLLKSTLWTPMAGINKDSLKSPE